MLLMKEFGDRSFTNFQKVFCITKILMNKQLTAFLSLHVTLIGLGEQMFFKVKIIKNIAQSRSVIVMDLRYICLLVLTKRFQ
jgi:hypothetical protein